MIKTLPTLLILFCCNLLFSQKVLQIDDFESYKTLNIYNADIYLAHSNDTIFLPKSNKKTYEISKEYEDKLAKSKDSVCVIIVETCNYIYLTKVKSNIIITNSYLGICYFKLKGSIYATISTDDTERSIASKRFRRKKKKFIQKYLMR